MKTKKLTFKEKHKIMEAIGDIKPEVYEDFRRWVILSMFARYCAEINLPDEAYTKDLHKLKLAASEFIGRAEADIRDFVDYMED